MPPVTIYYLDRINFAHPTETPPSADPQTWPTTPIHAAVQENIICSADDITLVADSPSLAIF